MNSVEQLISQAFDLRESFSRDEIRKLVVNCLVLAHPLATEERVESEAPGFIEEMTQCMLAFFQRPDDEIQSIQMALGMKERWGKWMEEYQKETDRIIEGGL